MLLMEPAFTTNEDQDQLCVEIFQNANDTTVHIDFTAPSILSICQEVAKLRA